MRSSGLHRAPTTPCTSGFSGQGRHAHIRLSKLRAWKLPNSRGRMCRTCVHSPAMQAESAVNAVATPTGAPTCPPCVASSAGLAQVSGAQEPGVLGSQPESPVPHASTVPPPVTRQPSAFTHCRCVWSHTPCPLQPAVVQESLSVSGHGVLFEANMCVCTHTPSSGFVPLISHPAVVHTLPSVSVHGVLVFGVHFPLVVSQPPLHSSAGAQTLVLWFWSHTPCPLQPAVVHALPSVSAHGVLFDANMCVCTHTPTLDAFSSHPAVVHELPSVSVHGVLTCCGVHVPAVWSQPRLHWSIVQLGQIGRSAVCEAPDCRVGLQVASPAPLMKPATSSTTSGVASLPDGSWLCTRTVNSSSQLPQGIA